MAEKVSSRIRLVKILQILNKSSIEEPVEVAEIVDALNADGIVCNRKTIYSDLRDLVDADIGIFECEKIKSAKGTKNKFYKERAFELSEIKLLVEALQGSTFIPERETDELCNKVYDNLCSKGNAEKIKNTVVLSTVQKRTNRISIANIETIHEAIIDELKIAFNYFDIGLNGQKEYRINKKTKEKKEHLISPICTIEKEGKYYLLGYSDGEKDITPFRIDKMDNMRFVHKKRKQIGEEEKKNLTELAQTAFGMYVSEIIPVKFKIKSSILNQMYDRFGENIEILVDSNNSEIYYFTAKVQLSPPFYAFVSQYGDSIEILGPVQARQGYIDHLKKVIAPYVKQNSYKGVDFDSFLH